MRYVKNYESFLIKEEKTWHYWLATGLIVGNLLINKVKEYRETEKAKVAVQTMFDSSKRLKYPEADTAKKYVIDKVINSDLKNKEDIINKINNIEFIEAPKELENTNPSYLKYDENGIKLEYVILTKSVFDSLPESYRIMALRHELMHLVDAHENGWQARTEIPGIVVSDLSEDQYYKIYEGILDNDFFKFKGLYDPEFRYEDFNRKKKYLTSTPEMFARINNLKFFLVKAGEIKNVNDDISKELWDDIYNGRLASRLNSKDLINDFYVSDFVELLPFIKNSNLSKLNKVACINTEIDTNLV